MIKASFNEAGSPFDLAMGNSQKTLDYAINYQKQNNQKISFLKLGCFIDI